MHSPVCPNHGCELDSTGDAKLWKCPVSSAIFSVSVEAREEEVELDKYGNLVTNFTINQLEGEDG